LHQLPPLHAADAAFSALATESGRAPQEADWQARGTAIAALIGDRPPDAILVEHYPFGRRPFRREVAEMLAFRAALTNKPYVSVSSVRDILVARKPARAAESAEGAWQVVTPRVDGCHLGGTGDAFCALFLGHFLRAGAAGTALERAASAMFTLVERTHASGADELCLVAAQDDFAPATPRFRAQRLD